MCVLPSYRRGFNCNCAELPVHIIVPLKPEEKITEGETVVLHVEVSKPDVPGTWFKDELKIIPKADKKCDAAVSGTVHELTIQNATTEDQAEYTLEIGEERTTAVLKIEGNNRPRYNTVCCCSNFS